MAGTGGLYETDVRAYTYLLAASLIFSPEVDDLSLPFYVKPAAASLFLYRLLDQGMPNDECSSPEAARALVAKWAEKLTIKQRTIDESDCVRVKPTTPHWTNAINISALRGADIDNRAYVDAMMLFDGPFSILGVDSTNYDEGADMLLPAVALSSDKKKAAAAIQWLQRSAPEEGFQRYFTVKKITAEIQRRSADTAEARFIPLFDACWRTAYPVLAELMGANAPASDARRTFKTLAAGLKMECDIVPHAVMAVCLQIRPYLQQAALEASRDGTASPEEQVQRLFAKVRSATGGKDADGKARLLLEDPAFMELYNSITAADTDSPDVHAIARTMMKAKSIVGLIYMSGKSVPLDAFDGLHGARNQSTVAAVFDECLSMDEDGNTVPECAMMLPTSGSGASLKHSAAMHLVEGKLTSLPWFSMCKKHIEKHSGRTTLERLPALDPHPHAFWFSAPHMRKCRRPLEIIMGAIGHNESRSVEGSWRNFYELQQRRAEAFEEIPDDILARGALLHTFYAALDLVFTGGEWMPAPRMLD